MWRVVSHEACKSLELQGNEVRYPKDKDSHTSLFFTFRPNRTTAKERRQYVPFPVKQERHSSRKARQEANRQKGKAKGTSKGQGKTKSKVRGKGKLPASSEPKTLSPKRYGIAQFQARLLQFALGIFTEMVGA